MNMIPFVIVACVAILLASFVSLVYNTHYIDHYKSSLDRNDIIKNIGFSMAISLIIVIVAGGAITLGITITTPDEPIDEMNTDHIESTIIQEDPALTIEDVIKYPEIIGKVKWVQISAGEYVSTNIDFGSNGYMTSRTLPFGLVEIDEEVTLHYNPKTMDMWLVKNNQFYDLSDKE